MMVEYVRAPTLVGCFISGEIAGEPKERGGHRIKILQTDTFSDLEEFVPFSHG